MQKNSTLTSMLITLMVFLGMGTAWADELPTPVYFNDFSSTDGLTIVGNGAFETDADTRFGQIYHNDPNLTKAIRTNYLLLPSDVLSHSAESMEMTIGFWVNMKSAQDFFWSPLFAAYDAAPANNSNSLPMFVCEARGLIQLNCAGWCDFGINDYDGEGGNGKPAGTTFNDATPYVTSAWLDDTEWHYYTIALTSTTAKVYVDGELKNGWTVDGTTDGQVINGLFTNGAKLNYVCLGGNQAWTWGDPDPAFAFDDFAVYDKALTADQIKQVIANKQTTSEAIVEVADIAAFNAVEDGKTVKLTLTNARVNGYNDLAGTFYVEDASGATAIKGINLAKGTALNGYMVGKKATEDVDYVNTPSQGLEYSLTVEDATLSAFTATEVELTGTPMTITQACAQTNYGKLVTLSDVTITAIGNGMNKQLTDADGNVIKTRDLFGVLPETYEWPAKASKITGVVLYYMTGWFIIPISAEAIEAAANQTAEALFDFANNNLGLTAGQGGASDDVAKQNAGNLGGKVIEQNGVKMSFVNPATMPVRYFYLSSKQTNHLQLSVKGAKMRLTAPEGKAIVKVVVVQNLPESTSNFVKWEVDKGAGTWDLNTKTWTGNTTSVRFSATAATYINSITVTLADKTSETITPEPDQYATEVSTLADFNALADGTLAKLTLTNAVITSGMINEWGCYVQDATAGAHFYCTGLDLKVNDVLNGYVYVMKSKQTMGSRIAMAEDTNADNLTITANGTFEPVAGTIAEVNVAENINKVVKLSGVAVKGTNKTTATVTDANGSTIAINNATTNAAPYVIKDEMTNIDYAKATVVAILYGASASENKLYPLSITEDSTDGITNINAANDSDNAVIYNLQGVRLNSLQKGINIVNGKKIVVK